MLNASPPPLLRTNRFWDALRHDRQQIIPLCPGSDTPISDCRPGTFDIECYDPRSATDEEIEDLDHNTEFNIGLVCGSISGCTVLAAETVESDEWIIGRDLPITSQSLSRAGRYYHFNYCSPQLLQAIVLSVAGLRILNDGDYLTYPGSVYEDGQIANWEIDPVWRYNADFPVERLLG